MNHSSPEIKALQAQIESMEFALAGAKQKLEVLQKDPRVVSNSEFFTEVGTSHFMITAKKNWNSCSMMLNKAEARDMQNALSAWLDNY